ncbi:MAG: ethylbenzene dehydrogenase-related protein [Acidimicrobiales bacterium]
MEDAERTITKELPMTKNRLVLALFAVSLVAASCGDDDADQGATEQAEVNDVGADDSADTAGGDGDEGAAGEVVFSDESRGLDAPVAAIVVDGEAADWADVEGLEMTLRAISDEDLPAKEARVKVAHDAENIFVLFEVDDDLDWTADDVHLSGSAAVQWAVMEGAGEAMGATDADRESSLGLVDIWHWEVECPAGEQSGGAVAEPGVDKDPGDDGACNFDDEYATDPETREDDEGDGAENSLLGVWTHSAEAQDGDGTWVFEMTRPLQTGDARDAQFEVGSSALMALAYWDADSSPEGWDDDHHVVSANQGWITVDLLAGGDGDEGAAGEVVFSDESRGLDAPVAAIVVDGEAADWADVEGLEMTLRAISDEDLPAKEARVKVAHDAENIFVLFEVDDDLDWTADDVHLSGSAAVQWAVMEGAGEAMGATDADRESSLGLVDIWHWEVECPAGEQSGGAVAEPGVDKDPGDDGACNFDDEYATDPETREDDEGDGAENSLLGVWTHSAEAQDGDGTWVFEMTRPLQTGDARDAQFEVGSSALMALAYWDADSSPEGWDDDHHVVSANQGWITVDLT